MKHWLSKTQCRKYSSYKTANLQVVTMKHECFTCLSAQTTTYDFALLRYINISVYLSICLTILVPHTDFHKFLQITTTQQFRLYMVRPGLTISEKGVEIKGNIFCLKMASTRYVVTSLRSGDEALLAKNVPSGHLPLPGVGMRGFDVSFEVSLRKVMQKQSRGR